jgi:hypothetical protein
MNSAVIMMNPISVAFLLSAWFLMWRQAPHRYVLGTDDSGSGHNQLSAKAVHVTVYLFSASEWHSLFLIPLTVRLLDGTFQTLMQYHFIFPVENIASSTHVLLVAFLKCSVFFLWCRSEDAPSFPRPSMGVFKERLGEYFPKSVTVQTVILLPTHELETPEITEADFFLSYCPKPPDRLVFREDEKEMKYCASETVNGERINLMASYECVNCVSFRTTIEEIRNKG